MPPGRVAVGVAQHPRDLGDPVLAVDRLHVARGQPVARLLRHDECRSARAAICGRWVITSTWCRSATSASASPTWAPTSPPIPWSTSSNTSVGTASCRASTTLSASISRDSSPPDATRASGRASSPTFSWTSNWTSSCPAGAGSAQRLERDQRACPPGGRAWAAAG